MSGVWRRERDPENKDRRRRLVWGLLGALPDRGCGAGGRGAGDGADAGPSVLGAERVSPMPLIAGHGDIEMART
jgi:hypothetical protein